MCESQSLLGEHKAVDRVSWVLFPALSSHEPTSTLVNHKSFPSGRGS